MIRRLYESGQEVKKNREFYHSETGGHPLARGNTSIQKPVGVYAIKAGAACYGCPNV